MMSEIPREALALMPPGYEAFGGHVSIEDVDSLRCTLDGTATRFLHYPDSPKPWQPRGWLRAGATAYAKLIRRLLFAPDVPLKLEPSDVADAIVKTLRYPRFEVFVPGYMSALMTFAALLPRAAREAMARALKADQVFMTRDDAARREYELRAARSETVAAALREVPRAPDPRDGRSR